MASPFLIHGKWPRADFAPFIAESDTVDTPENGRRMQTYILPSMDWAPLLQIIIKDARAGDIIEVHTAEMATYAQQAVQSEGRTDVTVVFRPTGRGGQPAPGDAEQSHG